MAQTINIRLTDAAGKVYIWHVVRVPRTFNCGGNLPKSRVINGWEFTDHDGYARFSEGNWLALVESLRMVAGNYGLIAKIS